MRGITRPYISLKRDRYHASGSKIEKLSAAEALRDDELNRIRDP
jgi:hypothetical protein